MKPRDARYEKVIERALRHWAENEFPGKKITVYGKRKWAISEREQPEIDAAVEIEGSIRVFVIAECKRWDGPVEVSVVREVAYLRSKLHAHLALIITTTGFQSGAKALAEDEGIKLIEAPESDPSSDKWKIIIPTGIVAWASLERNASAAQSVLPAVVTESVGPEPTSMIKAPTPLPPIDTRIIK